MALGDGNRRDIAPVSEAEPDRLIAETLQLDTTKSGAMASRYYGAVANVALAAAVIGSRIYFLCQRSTGRRAVGASHYLSSLAR
ncbi:MAG: hypothetical protein QOD01_2405 [Actinomycetota bacterium]|jgi:hypothetical protein|nr:hypothetical protein [Actinomycetota bacterium]